MLANLDKNIAQAGSLKELTAVYFENFLITSVSLKTRGNKEYFGTFLDGRLIETLESKVVIKTWQEIPSVYHNCSLGNFGFSPNEFTGILKIDVRLSDDNYFKYIPTIISRFKARSTRLLNQLHMTHSRVFWENSYTETPIENLNDLSEVLNKISSHK